VLPEEDHAVLGYEDWADGLERGIAAHHAGMIPLFKETVEELFERGLVRIVFATETLSLGINMPAKTVAIERLVKFTGERHELMTPGDYTQLTGRAGRRGIDPIGHGVVLWQSDIPIGEIQKLATAQSFPLSSSFRPSYNMAVNLVRRYSVEDAERLLNLSFGQFLADRSVTRQERQIEKNESFLDGYRKQMTCHLGDFAEYWSLVKQVRAAEKATRRDGTARRREQVSALRPGLVLHLSRGRMRGAAAVVDVRRSKGGSPQIVVVAADGRTARLGIKEFGFGPEVVGEIRLPRGDRRSRSFRSEVAKRVAKVPSSPATADADGYADHPPGGPTRPPSGFDVPSTSGGRVGESPSGASASPAASAVWESVREHPCHSCPDRAEHEKWAERYESLSKDTEGLRAAVRRRTETLARTFERVLNVLEVFGYVHGGTLTPKGERLCRVYNESDLLVAEVMDLDVLDGLETPDLAAVVSTLVYETRGFASETIRWPTDRVRKAFGAVSRTFRRIREAEEEQAVNLCREPDPGFAHQIWWWAKDEQLEDVLAMGELSAGDFVRATKQVWDLLRQLAEVAPSHELAGRFRDAARTIYRGVVAYSGAL
jgi:ATP-dependent RNA helicase HelY